jgi:hypothetical protein
MAASVNDVVLDAALDVIAASTLQIICSAEPTTRAQAVVTFALADVAMAAGDFTKANGDTSGRKLTMSAKHGVPIDANGNGTHIALVDATRLLYVTTCVLKPLTLGEMIGIPSWKIELRDPTTV